MPPFSPACRPFWRLFFRVVLWSLFWSFLVASWPPSGPRTGPQIGPKSFKNVSFCPRASFWWILGRLGINLVPFWCALGDLGLPFWYHLMEFAPGLRLVNMTFLHLWASISNAFFCIEFIEDETMSVTILISSFFSSIYTNNLCIFKCT